MTVTEHNTSIFEIKAGMYAYICSCNLHSMAYKDMKYVHKLAMIHERMANAILRSRT